MMKQRRSSAFSLVELSIVLFILGLLVGGILAGQSLIRAAELRAVSTEYTRYVTAVQSFRDKYFAIPGDFRDATRFWSRQLNDVNCPTNSSAAVVATGACDGDGDGRILTGGGAGAAQERFQFWRMLALSGMIEGSYSGVAGPGGSGDATSASVPTSKLSGAMWWANSHNIDNYGGDVQHYATNYGPIYMSIANYSPGFEPYLPTMRPEEAWNIDTKLDDGKPARGKVIAGYWNNLCAAADDGTHAQTDLVASYRLSDTTKQCILLFVRPF